MQFGTTKSFVNKKRFRKDLWQSMKLNMLQLERHYFSSWEMKMERKKENVGET